MAFPFSLLPSFISLSNLDFIMQNFNLLILSACLQYVRIHMQGQEKNEEKAGGKGKQKQWRGQGNEIPWFPQNKC